MYEYEQCDRPNHNGTDREVVKEDCQARKLNTDDATWIAVNGGR